MDNLKKALFFASHSIWQDTTPLCEVERIAKEAFDHMKTDCTKGKRLFRLTGQSGTGKTSQLLVATNSFCQKHNLRPLHLAVRRFAEYAPKFKNMPRDEHFRENTNGFALKALIYALQLAFEGGYDIILEIAMLDKRFEEFVHKSALSRSYSTSLQIMCVSKKISDILVLKRAKALSRRTSPSSSDYFYNVMEKSLKFVAKRFNQNCCIFSAFDLAPIYVGPLKGGLSEFKKQRKIIKKLSYSESELLQAKTEFLEALYRGAFL